MLDAFVRQPCMYLVLWLAATSAAAQPDSSEEERDSARMGPAIVLDEALARTMARNPALVAFGFQIQAAEGRLQQAGIAPNPELSVALNEAFGSGDFRAVNGAETTVSIAWAIERGMRQRQIDAARADVALTELDAQILRLDVAAQTALRFIACLAFQERLGFAVEQTRLAQQTIEAVRTRVDAGRATQAELSRAEAGLVRAELLKEDYTHELLSALHLLSAQWGETEPDFVAATGNIRTLPAPEPVEALLARVDRNPDLARYMSRERIAEAQLRVAQARGRPDWNVHAGVRRHELSDDIALVGGITIPFGTRNRNLGRIAETRADMSLALGEARAARVEIETALFVFYQHLRHNVQVATALRDRLIPMLERALADTRRAYELGRGTFVELTQVQAELLGANSEYLEASIGAHELVVEIERLTGETVLQPAPAQ